ncbi:hypothetical protein pb186bvf_000724 [Paramecium bursaria]
MKQIFSQIHRRGEGRLKQLNSWDDTFLQRIQRNNYLNTQIIRCQEQLLFMILTI